MRRFGIIGVYLFALAAWAQLLAPAQAARTMAAFDPFTIVCTTPSPVDGGSHSDRHRTQAHQCCVLCHAYMGGAPLDTRPAFTAFDYPVASRLRWRHAALAPPPPRLVFRHRPRDPPFLV